MAIVHLEIHVPRGPGGVTLAVWRATPWWYGAESFFMHSSCEGNTRVWREAQHKNNTYQLSQNDNKQRFRHEDGTANQSVSATHGTNKTTKAEAFPPRGRCDKSKRFRREDGTAGHDVSAAWTVQKTKT